MRLSFENWTGQGVGVWRTEWWLEALALLQLALACVAGAALAPLLGTRRGARRVAAWTLCLFCCGLGMEAGLFLLRVQAAAGAPEVAALVALRLLLLASALLTAVLLLRARHR